MNYAHVFSCLSEITTQTVFVKAVPENVHSLPESSGAIAFLRLPFYFFLKTIISVDGHLVVL